LQWPPPPRQTPIIVPSHLTTTTPTHADPHLMPAAATPDQGGHAPLDAPAAKGKAKATARQKSSLHRAVMERLEVQKAMKDLASGPGDDAPA
jgi:hypothetical protein